MTTENRLETWLAAERHQLVLFAPVVLGAGITTWFVVPTMNGWVAAAIGGVAIGIFGLLFSGLTRLCLVVAGLLFTAGVALAWQRAEAVRAPVLEAERITRTLTGTIVAVERQPARERTRLIVAIKSDGLPQGLVARIGIRGEPAPDVRAGARIGVRVSLTPPPGPNVPGGYHFARRAWFDGIGAVGYAISDVTVLKRAPPDPSLVRRLADLRDHLTRRLQEGVGGRAGGLAAALVTGDRGGIDEETTEAMRDSGLAHLISISGLHIAVVVGGIMWTARRMLAWSPWIVLHVDIKLIAVALAAIGGIAYTLLAGAQVPTIRACIAVLLALVGLVVGREAITLRLVAAGAFVILVVRPEMLIGPSFQMSFAAVTGIVALYQSPIGRRFAGGDKQAGIYNRLAIGAAAVLATSLVAELALTPIALFHFNQMGLVGLISNFVAIPLTSFVILPLLFLSIVADALGIGAPLFLLLGHAIDLLIDIGAWTESLPGAVSRFPMIPGWAFGLAMAGLVWIALWETQRRWAGILPVAIGFVGMATAPPPDIIVDARGGHVAVLSNEGLALLRPRAGDYVRTMWGNAAGLASSTDLDRVRLANCGEDSCTAIVGAGASSRTILATRSRVFIDRGAMEPVCRQADIVVSDRNLPYWCAPRWLKLDRQTLARTGAVAIWVDSGRVATTAAADGEHPWRDVAAVRGSSFQPLFTGAR